MASELAGTILNSAISNLIHKKGASYTLGFIESVLIRALNDSEINKINKILVESTESIA